MVYCLVESSEKCRECTHCSRGASIRDVNKCHSIGVSWATTGLDYCSVTCKETPGLAVEEHGSIAVVADSVSWWSSEMSDEIGI